MEKIEKKMISDISVGYQSKHFLFHHRRFQIA